MSMQLKAKEMVVLRAVASLERQAGVPPTVRELQRFCGFSTSSVGAYWLRKLSAQGLVEWRSSSSRTLRVTAAGRSVLDLAGVA